LDDGGNAKSPLISWLDNRATAEADELWMSLGDDWHSHCSFHELTGSMQLAHLLWLKRNMPESMDGGFRVVTLPGLVFDMLGGVNISDDNLAAMSGIYSLKDQCWRENVLNRIGISTENLPRIVPVGTPLVVQACCAELSLRKELSLVSAGNDQTAGAFGNGCREGDVIATLGTALVAYRRTGDQPGPYSKTGCWGPYPYGGYYELAYTNNGCQALDLAREVLMPGASIKCFDAAVERALHTITEATGTFYAANVRKGNAWQGEFSSKDEKAYAVLEGISFDLYKLVFNDLRAPATASLKVIGGGSHSDVWLQLIADVLNCTVSVGSGDSLLGAAAMATGCEVTPRKGKIFHPNPARHALLDSRRLAASAHLRYHQP